MHREISIQTEGGRASGQPPVLSLELRSGASRGAGVLSQDRPYSLEVDVILGTQKRQQQALVSSHWVLGLAAKT